MKFNFINLKETLALENEHIQLQYVSSTTTLFSFNRFLCLGNFLQNTNSINTVANTIREALIFHHEIGNLPDYLPKETNIKILNTNKITQFYRHLNGIEDTAFALNGPIPTISIFSDVLNDFDKDYLEEFSIHNPEDFLNNCRLALSHHDTVTTSKIMTELFFFHEMGHIVLDRMAPNSFLMSGYIADLTNPISQIIHNIEEGFSDCFSVYLASQHYPDRNLINLFQSIREVSQQFNSIAISTEESFIAPYNITEIFNGLNKQQQNAEHQSNDINKHVQSFLQIATDNSLKLSKNLLKEAFSVVVKYPELSLYNQQISNEKLYNNLLVSEKKSIEYYHALHHHLCEFGYKELNTIEDYQDTIFNLLFSKMPTYQPKMPILVKSENEIKETMLDLRKSHKIHSVQHTLK